MENMAVHLKCVVSESEFKVAGNAVGKVCEGLVLLDKMRSHEMRSDEMR